MKKRIICFGDSNTWGFNAATEERFPEGVRWTSLLASQLDDSYQVVEEGLSGRTSVKDDPLFEGLNAYNYIYPCLMSHSPLELVIIMLGTNDTKERFGLTSYNIAQGITRLAIKAKQAPVGIKGNEPRVLVIAPPPIEAGYNENIKVRSSMGKDCDIKSRNLSNHLVELLAEQDIEFLDALGIVPMNQIDYMHLNEQGHRKMAELVYRKIKAIL